MAGRNSSSQGAVLQRFRAHAALRRGKRDRYRAIFDVNPQPMFVFDANTLQLLDANHTTSEQYGYSHAELMAMRITDLWPEADVAKNLEEVSRPLPSIHITTSRHRRRDGSVRDVELRVHAMDRDGRATRLVLVTDVTERTLASLQDRTERMRTDDQRFQLAAIVDSSDDAIIGKTLLGVVTSWNAAARRLFGFSADEMIGRPITTLTPPGHEHEEADSLERLARGERIESFDTKQLCKDGSSLDVSVTISPVRDAAGTLVGGSKVIRDITARRRSEVQLARAKEMVEASNRELETFSYSVAHDLRAPLRGMAGFAQLLSDGYREQLDAEGQDWLQEIMAGARTMGSLIDAMLSLAKLNRSEMRPVLIDVSAIVRRAAGKLAAADPARTVTLTVEDKVLAELDPMLAQSLIDNLVGNAWKFTRDKPHAHIEFGTVERGDARTMFVRDNGAGFDMAYAGKLFAPFQRLHANAEFPGTGIGLATVQRIANRHGAHVSAEGVVGRGATFYLSFPHAQDGAPQ